MATMISTTAIKADPDCQPRIAIDSRIVDDYADDMTEGAGFPPLTVYHDGSTYWLADGFHRLAAAMRLGLAEIACDVRQGDKRAAILHSCSANATHGMRRTNADKRRAIESLLNDAEWATWSDREIARKCGVSHDFVSRTRTSLSSDDSESRTYTDRYGNVRTMDTSNIGKAAPAPQARPAPMTWTPPTSIPADYADDLFPDAEDYEPDSLPPVVEWETADAKAFAEVQGALTVIDRSPRAVAYAAFGTNPIGARMVLARAEQLARWYAELTAELRKIAD